jgi:hypothetical protein
LSNSIVNAISACASAVGRDGVGGDAREAMRESYARCVAPGAWPQKRKIVFTGQLLKGDTEVGHQAGVCTITSVARAEAQCVATYAFRGGQITGQALIHLGDPRPYAGAITMTSVSGL